MSRTKREPWFDNYTDRLLLTLSLGCLAWAVVLEWLKGAP